MRLKQSATTRELKAKVSWLRNRCPAYDGPDSDLQRARSARLRGLLAMDAP